MPTEDNTIDPKLAGEVRSELEALTQSILWSGSPRSIQLLTYVVEEDLAGRAHLLKAYSVAIDVFQRPDSFDPKTDSIVRVEMHKLRKLLELAYSDRQPRTLKIEIPKGSYRPQYSYVDDEPRKGASARENWRRFSVPLVLASSILALIAIGMFVTIGSPGEKPLTVPAAPKVRVEVKSSPAQAEEAILARLLSQANSAHGATDHIAITRSQNADYILDFSLMRQGTTGIFDLMAVLISANGETIYSKTYSVELPASDDDFSSLWHEINSNFFATDGVVVNYYSSDSSVDPRRRNFVRCQLDKGNHAIGLETVQFQPDELWDCSNPEFTSVARDKGIAHLVRAEMMINQYRGYADFGIEDPLGVANENLERAKDYLGAHPRLYHSRLLYEWERPDRDAERMRELLAQIEEEFPENTGFMYFTMASYGPFLGDWDRALEIAEELSALSNGTNYGLRQIHIDAAIAAGDFELAAEKLNLPGQISRTEQEGLRRYMIGCKSQSSEWVEEGKQLMEGWGPFEDNDLRGFILSRRYENALTENMISAVEDSWCQSR